MLFVHFTPKKNLKRIKRMGLLPKRPKYWANPRAVYLFPLLWGEKTLTNSWNRNWEKGLAKGDHQMAKIVVRVPGNESISVGCFDFDKPSCTVAEFGRWLASKALREEDGLWRLVEVRYDKPIRPAWIVKIYDRTNTDERTRRYRRERQPKDFLPERTKG